MLGGREAHKEPPNSQAVASGVTRPFEVPPCVIFAAAASEREYIYIYIYMVLVKILDPKPTDYGLLRSFE